MKKLDVRGFSHDFIAIAFVAIFAIAGVGYLVASHADECPPPTMSGPVVSGSGGCTQPQAFCRIQGVPPTPKLGQVLHPTVTVVNDGKFGITPTFNHSLTIYGKNNGLSYYVYRNRYVTSNLKSGDSRQFALTAYTVGPQTKRNYRGEYFVSGYSSYPYFSCSADFIQPLSTGGAPVTSD